MRITDSTIHQYTISEVVHYVKAGVLEYEGSPSLLVEWIAGEYENGIIPKREAHQLEAESEAHNDGYYEAIRDCIDKLESML